MSSILALLSPAKLIDDQTHYPNLQCAPPEFTKEAQALIKKLGKLKPTELAELMDMSESLAQETHLRFKEWHLPFSHANAHPAILMFKGEVYRGLKAEELNPKQLAFAQKHIRILSGLYGVLRPLDWAMPYRLMMGTPFVFDKKTPNLYAFWQEKITSYIDSELNKNGALINLASNEYFKCIDLKKLNRRVIHCEFKENRGGKFVTVNTYAKHARGSMARFIIENSISKPDDIRSFDTAGYTMNSSLSTETHFVFCR